MGRALIRKEPGQEIQIPDDLAVISEVDRPLEGEVWVIIEGDDLPDWERGTIPVFFDSLDDLLTGRTLYRIAVESGDRYPQRAWDWREP